MGTEIPIGATAAAEPRRFYERTPIGAGVAVGSRPSTIDAVIAEVTAPDTVHRPLAFSASAEPSYMPACGTSESRSTPGTEVVGSIKGRDPHADGCETSTTLTVAARRLWRTDSAGALRGVVHPFAISIPGFDTNHVTWDCVPVHEAREASTPIVLGAFAFVLCEVPIAVSAGHAYLIVDVAVDLPRRVCVGASTLACAILLG